MTIEREHRLITAADFLRAKALRQAPGLVPPISRTKAAKRIQKRLRNVEQYRADQRTLHHPHLRSGHPSL